MDSCYLCELDTEGLIVPLGDMKVRICFRCVLDAIYRHPKLWAFKKEAAA